MMRGGSKQGFYKIEKEREREREKRGGKNINENNYVQICIKVNNLLRFIKLSIRR